VNEVPKPLKASITPLAFLRRPANTPLAEEEIVRDRFHVMKLATVAVDKVRRQEHRELKKDDD
jgi:hypothetical protein